MPPCAAERIRAVAINMTTVYELAIKAHCPQVEVLFDPFHVVAKYGREVIDRFRQLTLARSPRTTGDQI
jgi:transposase